MASMQAAPQRPSGATPWLTVLGTVAVMATIDVLGSAIDSTFSTPLRLDAWGSIAAAIFGGWIPGVGAALLGSLIMSVTAINPFQALDHLLTTIVVVATLRAASRLGRFRTMGDILAVVLVASMASIVVIGLLHGLFPGLPGDPDIPDLACLLAVGGLPPSLAVPLAALPFELVDKSLGISLCWMLHHTVKRSRDTLNPRRFDRET